MSRPADCIYLTHPEVRIDPAVPVPEWGLSERGLQRARAGLRQPFVADLRHIVSSNERKARETAGVFAERLALPVLVDEAMHENDRSATGYLPPEEFEQVADRFFAEPTASVRGWERAADAQARIVSRVGAHLARIPEDEAVLFVGHGGVGTLLKCHLCGLPISRLGDQPAGGGGFFVFSRKAVTGQDAGALVWRPIDR
ncbi:histidine phosphatase family protein [Stappia indica]|uniref:histidine phosphatase family protein n=1 Tax=Stappia indica TaxID=538381 RepID=UPI001CD52267|nr:histidine phosphatase family protein [Stappia indica]MCA1299914.1 phosphoglycerate mutase family protein [Stappia indica]